MISAIKQIGLIFGGTLYVFFTNLCTTNKVIAKNTSVQFFLNTVYILCYL